MYHDTIRPAGIAGFQTMAFSDRVMRMLAAAGSAAAEPLRPANPSEALTALSAARAKIGGLVPDAVALAALEHNPEIFQLAGSAEKRRDDPSFLAFLPLRVQGAEALARGHFNGAAPDLNVVCKPGESPAAIYIWLIYAPRTFTGTLRALAPLLGRLAPEGCPLFTRAVTGHTERLFPAMGFVKAQDTYPDAAADLLVLPPRQGLPTFSAPSTTPPAIAVRVARTMEDLLKVFSVRAATYMAEQHCPFEEEFDGNDFCATHFLGEIDGEPAGCIRVRYFADFVKIERLAVRQEFRQSRLSFRLVREAIEHCRRKGYSRAYGHSRFDLTRFWGLFGFRPLMDRPAFHFSDVEYVELEAKLAPTSDRLAIGEDPYVMIRPEGEWDRPGPLDRSRDRRRSFDLRPPRPSGQTGAEAHSPGNAGTA
jgi:predicted GNAT family N-acyltransferase